MSRTSRAGKTDADWLVHLLECGLLAGSFIPPAEIKATRDVFRYRTKVAQQRVSEIARLGNVLQDAGIKIDLVASSIATKSGRAMIEALIDGERRGPVLAELAKGKIRAKIADLSMALEGRFGDHHALMCRLHLDHVDHLEAMIARLDAQIEAMMIPFRAQRDLLATVPGIGLLSTAGVSARSGSASGNTLPPTPQLSEGDLAAWLRTLPHRGKAPQPGQLHARLQAAARGTAGADGTARAPVTGALVATLTT